MGSKLDLPLHVFIFTESIHQEHRVYFSHYYLEPLFSVFGGHSFRQKHVIGSSSFTFQERELAMRFSIRMNDTEELTEC